MKWSDITVFQFQKIAKYIDEPDSLERETKLISAITGLTVNEVELLPLDIYREHKKNIAFINEPIEGEKVKVLTVNGRRYKAIYDMRKINTARYIETKVFASNVIENLHKIAASMFHPLKFTIIGWREDVYDPSKHEEYSQDMLEAKFLNVYFSVVFFYHVYKLWIGASMDYLIKELEMMGKEREIKELRSFLNIMDGSIL